MPATGYALISERHMLGNSLMRTMLGERISDIIGARDFDDADFTAGNEILHPELRQLDVPQLAEATP